MRRLSNVQQAKEVVKAKVNIFDVISEDIHTDDREWKTEGKYKTTRSPFRDERTPSFKIDEKKFIDFGGEGHHGDVFAWVMLWHAMSFPEAIVYLADRYNVDITPYVRDPTPEEIEINRFKQLNRLAVDYFQEQFQINVQIRDNYLNDSGFTMEQVEPYQVGYCPNKNDLINYVHSRMVMSEEDVFKLEFGRGDMFNDAIIYPVHNASGDVLGFYARPLNPGPTTPKYLSTKHTHPLFDKSVLYGMHVAKSRFRETGPVVRIVEGFRDAIATGGVAVRSSEITKEQIQTLKDFNVRKAIVCYDGDATGFKKTNTLAMNPEFFGDIELRIARPCDDITRTEDKIDPHEVYKRWGKDAVDDMFAACVTPIEFFINSKFSDLTKLSINDKYTLLQDLKPFFVKTEGLHADFAAAHIASIFDCPKSTILDHIAAIKVQEVNLFNLEAERVIISKCMSSSAEYNTFKSMGIASPCFTLSLYRIIFETCKIAYDKYADKYTPQVIVDEVAARHLIPDLPKMASQILNEEPKYEPRVAGELVLDMWRRRTAVEQGKQLAAQALDIKRDFNEVLQTHRHGLVSSLSTFKKQAITPKETLAEAMALIQERNQNKGRVIGYDFGRTMSNLNVALSGLQLGSNIIISGGTGTGKSILALNMIIPPAIYDRVPTLWLGLEMRSVQNVMRALSVLGGIDNTKMQHGIIEDFSRLHTASTKYLDSGLYFYRPQQYTEDGVLAAIDEFRFKYGIKIVVIDYIQLINRMASQRGMAMHEVLSSVSKMFKNRVSEDMGMVSILISQMNRAKDASGTDKVGGAIAIAQDADDFLEVKRKTKKQMQDDGGIANRYLHLHKRRSGAGDILIHAHYDDERGRTLRFSEADPPDQLAKNMVRSA